MDVYTSKGYIDSDKLVVKDLPAQLFGNNRVIVTQWYLDDELVRQDLLGNILSGIQASGAQGEF